MIASPLFCLHLFFLYFLCLISTTSAYKELSDATLSTLPEVGSDFDIKTGALLSPILIPRVPGTPGSLKVLNHFVSFFKTHLPQWRLEFQNSTQQTPSSDKPLPFVNLIATRDPPWAEAGDVGRLALVAHYDSKLHPEGFIGAIDSAAPCAMLLHAARSVDAALTKRWDRMAKEEKANDKQEKGVQVILLDGEEAFLLWSDDDSLYGARALAEAWEVSPHPAVSTFHNPLDSIELFLLLDLLGAKDPDIPSYFRTTHWAYRALGKLEHRLRAAGQFKSSPNHPSKGLQKRAKEPKWLIEADNPDTETRAWMQDDHLPFMARGVEVLHMIPQHFPSVWHTIDDDGEHLDMDTTEDWAKLVTAFTAEWMDLDDFMAASELKGKGKGKGKGEGEEEHAASDKKKRKAEDEAVGVEDKSELNKESPIDNIIGVSL